MSRFASTFWKPALRCTFSAVAALGISCNVTPAYAQNAIPIGVGEKDNPQTRSIMQSIYQPLIEVLVLSFDDKEFTSPKNQPKIKKALNQLVKNASDLDHHVRGSDAGFQYVAHSLMKDLRHTSRWYNKAWYNEARFTLHNLTENCIACHSSLAEKDNHKIPAADQFFEKSVIEKLPELEQAHLMVMSRQFDQALTVYENYFKQDTVNAETAVNMQALYSYLKVCIRVKQTPNRAVKLLEHLQEKADKDSSTQKLLQSWISGLNDLAKKPLPNNQTLAIAAKLISQAQDKMEFSRSKEGLIEYIAASGVMQEYIYEKADAIKPAQLAEIYYALGITESLLESNFWLSKAESYWEAAIRTAPRSKAAEKSFNALKSQIVIGFTGSAGTQVPEDVRVLLDELEKLMSSKQDKKKSRS